MKTLLVLCAVCFLTSCATHTRVAPGMPVSSAVKVARDLAGTYSNVGWVHSPDEYHAIEAYLDIALGVANYPERHSGGIVLRGDGGSIVVMSVKGDRVLRKVTLVQDRDYRVTAEGIELTRISKGSGPEGTFYMKVTTRTLLRKKDDGSLVLEAHEDADAMALWPYSDSRVVWYEFKKEG